MVIFYAFEIPNFLVFLPFPESKLGIIENLTDMLTFQLYYYPLTGT